MVLLMMTAELVKFLGHSLKLPLYQAGQALLVLSKARKHIINWVNFKIFILVQLLFPYIYIEIYKGVELLADGWMISVY